MIFNLVIYVILSLFFFSVGIITGRGIRRIYKYDQRNLPYPYPSTTFVIPPCFDTYMQNQRNSAYDASTGANDEATYLLDQRTNHHVHTDFNKNGDSQSLVKPRKSDCSSSSFGDTITTKTTPRPSTLPSNGKYYLCYQIEGGRFHAAQCDKSRVLIIGIKSIFEIDSFEQ